MKLIAILLVLATEDTWKSFRTLRPYRALIDFACRLQARFGERPWFNGPGGVLLAVAPGVIGIGLLQFTLDAAEGFVAWLVALVFAIAVLILSIGRRGAEEEIDEYLGAIERGDHEGAYLHVRELLQGEDPLTAPERHRLVIEMMLLRNHERLLAVLFWFVVLGPAGAVLYRSSTQLKGVLHSGRSFHPGFLEAVLRLQAFLDWVPARITALCHALVGSFAESIHQWRDAAAGAIDLHAGNRAVLIGSGLGSLRLSEDVAVEAAYVEAFTQTLAETRGLIYRTIVVWVTVFAALTIVGWLS